MPFFYRKSNTVLQKPPFSDSGLCRAVSKSLKAQAAVLLLAPYMKQEVLLDAHMVNNASAAFSRHGVSSSMNHLVS